MKLKDKTFERTVSSGCLLFGELIITSLMGVHMWHWYGTVEIKCMGQSTEVGQLQ